jgi:hypothetical protein
MTTTEDVRNVLRECGLQLRALANMNVDTLGYWSAYEAILEEVRDDTVDISEEDLQARLADAIRLRRRLKRVVFCETTRLRRAEAERDRVAKEEIGSISIPSRDRGMGR